MHLPTRRALMILSAVTAMAVAACSGGAASPTVSLPALPSVAIPTVSIPPLPSGLPSELPSGLPSGQPSFAIPSMHQAPDLEALLPSQLRGTTLDKLSLAGGGGFANSGSTTNPELQAILTQFNKTPADLAIAGATDPSNTLEFDLGAYRLAGVDANQLLAAAATAGLTGASGKPAISTATISGKAVTVLTDSDGKKQYAYPRGDVLFLVASDAADADALVADIFAALP